LFDEDIENNAFGHLWHFFDQELRFPASQLHTSQLSARSLRNYSLLVLTDGNYDALDSSKMSAIRSWVGEGGRLVLLGDALSVFEDQKGFALTKFAVKKERETFDEARQNEQLRRRFAPFDKVERSFISQNTPGAIFKITLDNSHPLAFGMRDYYFSLKTSSGAYQPLKGCWNVGYINNDMMKLGFVGEKARENLRGSMVFAVQDIGRGNVIYLQDNPLFRSFWYQGKFLFSNAIFQKMR
jgi:hypothetical protein